MPEVQRAVQALLKAVATPGGAPAPAIPAHSAVAISRDHGAGGDEVAVLLAKRLGVELYSRVIIDRIAQRLDTDPATMRAIDAGSSAMRDLWLYSLVTGQDLDANHYKRHLVNVVLSLGRTGGVILGSGAHLILAHSGILRVRITGSPESCARRLAVAEHIDIDTARHRVEETNQRRAKFVWEHFHERLDDPRTFDLVINTDHITDFDKVVDMLVAAMKMVEQPALTVKRP